MIIVKSKYQSDFENDYIAELILSFNKNLKIVTPDEFFELDKTTQNKSKVLIVYSPGDEKVFLEIDNFIEKIPNKYSLIHLSDETLTDPICHYEGADIILRSYFNPKIKYLNCFTIPVGYQNGYQNSIEIKTERLYTWSFLGQIYSTRKHMLINLLNFKPSFLHVTEKFMSNSSIPSMKAKEIYMDSWFAPCPFGYINPDTFRIMEVLEAGCVPIVQKMPFIDYYKYIFGDHPFIVVKNWKEINKIISNYTSNPDSLESKQKEVFDWYKNFKIELSKDTENILLNNSDNLDSKQFSYQKQIGLNVVRNFIFFYWFNLKRDNKVIKIQKMIKKLKKFLKTLVSKIINM